MLDGDKVILVAALLQIVAVGGVAIKLAGAANVMVCVAAVDEPQLLMYTKLTV